MPKYKVPVIVMVTHEVEADLEVEADSVDHAVEEALASAEYDYGHHDWQPAFGGLGTVDVHHDSFRVSSSDIEILDND